MIRLLRWLVWGDGHLHVWKLYSEDRVTRGDITVGYYDYRCETCEKFREFRT